MLVGLTMVKVSSGQERAAYARLQRRPGIREVYPLFGEYSFFLVMEAEEEDDLGRMLGDIRAEESLIKAGPLLLSREGCDQEKTQAPGMAAA